MYNYSFDKNNKTKEIVEKAGCKILFLFLYSPDFNPIENYWAVLKARLKKIKNQCNNFYKAINLAFQIDY
jgi:transposase